MWYKSKICSDVDEIVYIIMKSKYNIHRNNLNFQEKYVKLRKKEPNRRKSNKK